MWTDSNIQAAQRELDELSQRIQAVQKEAQIPSVGVLASAQPEAFNCVLNRLAAGKSVDHAYRLIADFREGKRLEAALRFLDLQHTPGLPDPAQASLPPHPAQLEFPKGPKPFHELWSEPLPAHSLPGAPTVCGNVLMLAAHEPNAKYPHTLRLYDIATGALTRKPLPFSAPLQGQPLRMSETASLVVTSDALYRLDADGRVANGSRVPLDFRGSTPLATVGPDGIAWVRDAEFVYGISEQGTELMIGGLPSTAHFTHLAASHNDLWAAGESSLYKAELPGDFDKPVPTGDVDALVGLPSGAFVYATAGRLAVSVPRKGYRAWTYFPPVTGPFVATAGDVVFYASRTRVVKVLPSANNILAWQQPPNLGATVHSVVVSEQGRVLVAAGNCVCALSLISGQEVARSARLSSAVLALAVSKGAVFAVTAQRLHALAL